MKLNAIFLEANSKQLLEIWIVRVSGQLYKEGGHSKCERDFKIEHLTVIQRGFAFLFVNFKNILSST